MLINWKFFLNFYLTNRFHVAVRLFSNRSQMTSKCSNKKVAHEAQPSVSLMFLPHFDVFCNLLMKQTHGNMESFYIYIYIVTKSLFLILKYFNITRKPAFCPAFAPPLHVKKPFDVIYDLYKMKQFHWLLYIAKNCDWSRKIAPLSNLTRASLLVE